MAISKNALLTAGLATFGISMVLAAGPYGLAFGVALFYSSLIALAMTAIVYGISEGNLNMKSSTRPSVTTHSRTFVPAPTHTPVVVIQTPRSSVVPVVHTKHFEPAVPKPTAPVVHTRHFEPAVPKPTAPVVHTQTFVPAQKQASKPAPVSHTRHFEPAAPKSAAPVVHTRHFEPAGSTKGFTPGFVAAKTTTTRVQQPNVNMTGVTHTRTFVPK